MRKQMPQTANINIDEEIERRQVARKNLQTKIDMEELERRSEEVNSGRSRLISPEEFWDNVEKAGF
ncbi:MAG: hypothetical protein LBL54_01085 [Clostridiales Family XIII bacterium]|jgi:hypothetical protein|nr:hypothetical protein [Clostridiales Family XIII bacterium]